MGALDLIIKILPLVFSFIAFVMIMAMSIKNAMADKKVTPEERNNLIAQCKALMDIINNQLPNIPLNAIVKQLKVNAKCDKKKAKDNVPQVNTEKSTNDSIY